MKAYRIYIVDPDGRLHLGQSFEAGDDELAASLAASFAERGRAAELWERGRIVGKITAAGAFLPSHSPPRA